MCDPQLQMVSRIENFNFNNMHYDRLYIQRSRKHQLPRQQRGIYIDLQTMQQTIYWRNGTTVYWKVERTPLWYQSETTLPGR